MMLGPLGTVAVGGGVSTKVTAAPAEWLAGAVPSTPRVTPSRVLPVRPANRILSASTSTVPLTGNRPPLLTMIVVSLLLIVWAKTTPLGIVWVGGTVRVGVRMVPVGVGPIGVRVWVGTPGTVGVAVRTCVGVGVGSSSTKGVTHSPPLPQSLLSQQV